MLQLALLLFSIGLGVFLWDVNVSAAEVVVGVISIGFTFYACIAVSAMVWKDCPFPTPLPILLPMASRWMKEITVLALLQLRRGSKRLLAVFQHRIKPPTMNASGDSSDPYPEFSSPTLWRQDPMFTPLLPEDVSASAGFWLLENSTDLSVAATVAATFPEFQLPSHQPSTMALVRLRDAYMECFRQDKGENKLVESAGLKAVQTAGAYYLLYHTQIIWNASRGFDAEVEKILSDLPPDLFVHEPCKEWYGDDIFEYLLHIEDKSRSDSVTSARFLSYIAPYWSCGHDKTAVKFRLSRLQTVQELIEVLKKCGALTLATLTECVLCIGVIVNFPVNPEDLIRVDKRCVRFLARRQ